MVLIYRFLIYRFLIYRFLIRGSRGTTPSFS